MKKLWMLVIAAGFVGLSAQAEVGKDKDKVDCAKVVKEVQERLKEAHPADAAPATPAAPGPTDAQPAT